MIHIIYVYIHTIYFGPTVFQRGWQFHFFFLQEKWMVDLSIFTTMLYVCSRRVINHFTQAPSKMYFCQEISHSGLCHNFCSFVEKELGVPESDRCGCEFHFCLLTCCMEFTSLSCLWNETGLRMWSWGLSKTNVMHLPHRLAHSMCLINITSFPYLNFSKMLSSLLSRKKSLIRGWWISHMIQIITFSRLICGTGNFLYFSYFSSQNFHV